MEETTITVNHPRELIIVKQGKTEVIVDLRKVKLKSIGQPTREQIQSQHLAIAILLTGLCKGS